MTSNSDEGRAARLALALRENLKRRKAQAMAQARAKDEGNLPTPVEAPPPKGTQERPKSAPKEF
jgi:hypothetical protein